MAKVVRYYLPLDVSDCPVITALSVPLRNVSLWVDDTRIAISDDGLFDDLIVRARYHNMRYCYTLRGLVLNKCNRMFVELPIGSDIDSRSIDVVYVGPTDKPHHIPGIECEAVGNDHL